MSLAEVVAAWEVVGATGLREAIHPTGADGGAYDASGDKTAAAVLEAFGNLPPGPLIDFGAGDGRVAIPLSYQTNRSILAADSSAAMLDQLRRRPAGGRGVSTFLADGTSPLPERAAGIYAIAVLIHHRHEDAARIVSSLADSLFPDGKLVLDLPLYEESREPKDWIDIAVWTLPELEELASSLGLRVTSSTVYPGAFSWETVHPHDWVVLEKTWR